MSKSIVRIWRLFPGPSSSSKADSGFAGSFTTLKAIGRAARNGRPLVNPLFRSGPSARRDIRHISYVTLPF
jgi:hypothetical protein